MDLGFFLSLREGHTIAEYWEDGADFLGLQKKQARDFRLLCLLNESVLVVFG